MKKIFRKPYRVKRKKSIFRNRFFWLGILILIIFGGFFYSLIYSSTFQIKEIKISGNQKVLTENLQDTIQNQIEKKVLFLPTKSIFLANLNKISETILEKFPQITQINLDRKFPDILIVEIEEREPAAVFCNDNCFFIDKEGIVFEELDPNVTRKGNVTLKKDIEREINLGEEIIRTEQLSKILEIESQLRENFKIPIKEVLIVSDQRVDFKTVEGWEIYFNPQGDLNWQLTKLRVVLEEEIPPENRQNLEYIELRFGNFAPYKYREQ